MNVLTIAPFYAPKRLVGAWLATHLFMRHLASQGHTVTVVAVNDSGPGWTHEGVKVVTGSRGRQWITQRATEADVVVSHFGHAHMIKAGRPSVQMVHGHIHRRPRSADLLVFNSQASSDASIGTGPSIVCSPPVSPADHRVPVTGECVTIVNCSLPKGILTATRCAVRLPQRPFLGVRGDYDDQQHPDLENFSIIGSQPDMRAVWAQTRILLMPSEYETYGMVGVEAMCSGVPVIANPTPGLRESLGDAGIWVDRDDTEGWVREIERLDDPTEYADASRRALARVEQLDPRLSLDRFTEAITELVPCLTS